MTTPADHQPHAPSSPMERLDAHAKQDEHQWIDVEFKRGPECALCGIAQRDWEQMRQARAQLEALPQTLMTDLERRLSAEVEFAERHWVMFEGETHRWQDRAEKAEAELAEVTQNWQAAEEQLCSATADWQAAEVQLTAAQAERDQARTALAKQQAVVDAARAHMEGCEYPDGTLDTLDHALAALDAATSPLDQDK